MSQDDSDDDNPLDALDSFRMVRELQALRDQVDPPQFRQMRALRDTLRAAALSEDAHRNAIVRTDAYRIASSAARAVSMQTGSITSLTSDALALKAHSPISQVLAGTENRLALNRVLNGIHRDITSGTRFFEAIRAARGLLSSGVVTPEIVRDVALRCTLQGADEAAALIQATTYFGALRMENFRLRAVFGDHGGSSDLASDVDAIVDTLDRAWRDNDTDEVSSSEPDRQPQRVQERSPREVDLPVGIPLLRRSRADLVVPPIDNRWLSFRPIRVFCGSARSDERHRDALMKHLSVLRNTGKMTIWHDGLVEPGTDREGMIYSQMGVAQLLVLLISSDYLDELYCTGLMTAIEAERERWTILPVRVRRVDYDDTFLKRLAQLPANGQPVTGWQDPDDAWTDVAVGVRTVIESLRDQAYALLPPHHSGRPS